MLLVAAMASACVPGELGDTFEFGLDWGDSDDPALQAASFAPEEVLREHAARETFSQATEDMDAVGFAHAATLRPLDSRYSVYAAVLYSTRGDADEADRFNQRAMDALKLLHPDADAAEITRRWTEMTLEAQRDLLVNGGNDQWDASLSSTYCEILTNWYPNYFGGSADGALFMATADYTPCT
jgi:hypothetical protein